MRPPVLVVLAAAAAFVLSGCGTVGTVEAGGDVTAGKQLFQDNCGSCHVLADAGTKGTVGPNLDDALGHPRKQGIDESTLRDIVRGQIAYASPPMPQDLVTGDDADAVATYVAKVAGQPVQGGGEAAPPPTETTQTETTQTESQPTTTTESETETETETTGAAGGTEAAGKSVFTTNCASCHTLADANATGTIGPNLDELQPPQDVVAHQVEVGGGAMPAFKGTLTDEQIQEVAAYVAAAAGS